MTQYSSTGRPYYPLMKDRHVRRRTGDSVGEIVCGQCTCLDDWIDGEKKCFMLSCLFQDFLAEWQESMMVVSKVREDET